MQTLAEVDVCINELTFDVVKLCSEDGNGVVAFELEGDVFGRPSKAWARQRDMSVNVYGIVFPQEAENEQKDPTKRISSSSNRNVTGKGQDNIPPPPHAKTPS